MIKLIYSDQAKLTQITLKKVLDKDHPDRNEYNYISFDMGITSVEELVAECEMHSLCFESKAVVAENCYFLDKVGEGRKKKKDPGIDKLLSYVENEDPATDLYLTLYADVLDNSNPIIQTIMKKHTYIHAEKMSPSQWLDSIKIYFTKKGYAIDDDAIQEIYNRSKGDYALFLNEGKKLLAYKAEEMKIELCDVMTMMPPLIDEDTFRMCNYLAIGDVENAFKVYKGLKTHSVDEMTLLGTLASQFIFSDKVLYLDSKGLSADQIAAELNQKKSARVFITLKNYRKFNSVSIARILEQLYEAESAILSGSQTPEFAFSRFLANFKI